MKIVCTLISCFSIVFLLLMVYLEYKKRINFSSKIGKLLIYFINYSLILVPYCIESIYSAPIIEGDTFLSRFAQEFLNNLPEILVLVSIVCSNCLTKLLYKNLCNIDSFNGINKKHQNVITGLILSLVILAIPFGDFGLFFAYALLGFGNYIGYSIYKSPEEKLVKNDYIFITAVSIITVVVLGLFALAEKHLSTYKNQFLYPWIITLVLLIVIAVIIVLLKKHNSKKKITLEQND